LALTFVDPGAAATGLIAGAALADGTALAAAGARVGDAGGVEAALLQAVRTIIPVSARGMSKRRK
jgi:hypothetical protein